MHGFYDPDEHILSKLLYKAGYSRRAIRDSLGVAAEVTLHKYLCSPKQYFTLVQYEIVSGMLNVPVSYVVGLALGYKRDKAKSWFDPLEDNKQDH